MNAIVLQSGGPTAVVNASLIAVIESRPARTGGRLWGARQGWRGLVTGDWAELTELPREKREVLRRQPGAALGSGRDRLEEKDIPALLDRLKRSEIGVVFVIGGNGSMVAAHKLYQAARGGLTVIGIPKTIDNDLPGTDVCPGYPSAARWVAQSVHDAGLDLHAMRGFDDVAVVEVMGRHTGWLAAAAALARWEKGTPPHVILLPEVPFDETRFLDAVKRQNDREGFCLVVAAEGARDGKGAFLAGKGHVLDTDPSGQTLLALAGGPAPYLARIVHDRLGLRCRQMRPDTIQRSSGALASEIDRNLALAVGRQAADAATEAPASGVLIGIRLQGSRTGTTQIPLEQVVGPERPLPAEFIDAPNFDVTPAFVDYAKPLLGEWNPEAILL